MQTGLTFDGEFGGGRDVSALEAELALVVHGAVLDYERVRAVLARDLVALVRGGDFLAIPQPSNLREHREKSVNSQLYHHAIKRENTKGHQISSTRGFVFFSKFGLCCVICTT